MYEATKPNKKIRIDVSHVPSGIYLCNIQADGELTKNKKIIIEK